MIVEDSLTAEERRYVARLAAKQVREMDRKIARINRTASSGDAVNATLKKAYRRRTFLVQVERKLRPWREEDFAQGGELCG